MRHRFSLAALWLAALTLPAAALQTPQQPPDQKQEGDREKPKAPPQFRASVDRVALYVSVYTQDGQMVSGLQRDDFTVFEDKVEQQITYFGLEDVASTIGMVMDSSGSMRGRWDMVEDAANLFLDTTHPDNELFLIDFKDQVSLEEDFTRDPDDIRDALENVITTGGTALLDAIYLGVDKAREGHEPKKAILVFTDGEDKDSYYSYELLLKKIQESDVQVYIVAFISEDLSNDKGIFGVFKSEREKVQQEIRAIAEITGGKAFLPNSIDELSGIFGTIARELRNQYRVVYAPKNTNRDGTWREIDVIVKGARENDYKVRSRKGYYAR